MEIKIDKETYDYYHKMMIEAITQVIPIKYLKFLSLEERRQNSENNNM